MTPNFAPRITFDEQLRVYIAKKSDITQVKDTHTSCAKHKSETLLHANRGHFLHQYESLLMTHNDLNNVFNVRIRYNTTPVD